MTDTAGFFGKLPSHGDFVNRRVSREFLEVWDPWLQRGIAECKAVLGDQWLDRFLTSPIWRFVMTPDVCDEHGYAGAIMPSVDRVGRYFPLAIIAPLPVGSSPMAVAATADQWFGNVECLLLSVLSEDAPQLEQFDQAVLSSDPSTLWAAHSGVDIADLVVNSIGPHSIWWTASSDVSTSEFVVARKLPPPDQFVTMISSSSGSYSEPEPAVVPDVPLADTSQPAVANIPEDFLADLEPTVPPAVEPTPPAAASVDVSHLSIEDLVNMPSAFRVSSAALTDTGKVRRENEDAVLEKIDDSIWVVADGMGGHAAGKTASATVVTAIDRIDLPQDIESRIDAISRSLQAANRELLNYSVHSPENRGLGSTVAVLTIVGNAAAVVWAGDTRVYRKRGQQLEQLTTDHSERQEQIDRGDINSILGPSNIVTRAVGGEEVLQVSTIRETLQPGDRFLICSDGVYEEVPIHELVEVLDQQDVLQACSDVLGRVNEGQAADNASAVVVDVHAG